MLGRIIMRLSIMQFVRVVRPAQIGQGWWHIAPAPLQAPRVDTVRRNPRSVRYGAVLKYVKKCLVCPLVSAVDTSMSLQPNATLKVQLAQQ